MTKSIVCACLVFGLALIALAEGQTTRVDQNDLNRVMIDFAKSSGAQDALNSDPGCTTVTDGATFCSVKDRELLQCSTPSIAGQPGDWRCTDSK